MISGKKKLIGIVGAVALLGIIGGGVAVATGVADDTDEPITGEAYELATEAALDHTGGGRVTGTEVGDEESYYEVEVTLDDGSQIDVQLDEDFNRGSFQGPPSNLSSSECGRCGKCRPSGRRTPLARLLRLVPARCLQSIQR